MSVTVARPAHNNEQVGLAPPLIVAFDFEGHRTVPHFAVLRLEPRRLTTGVLRPFSSSGPPSVLEIISRVFEGPPEPELWVATEYRPRRRSAARAVIEDVKASFPMVRFVALGTWDILAGIGFPHRPGASFPTSEQIHEAVMVRAGAGFYPASFDDTWTAAVALAGAERVWASPMLRDDSGTSAAMTSLPENSEPGASRRGLPATPPPEKDLLSIADICLYFQKSRMWVYRHLRGQIQCVRPRGARAVFYRKSDIEKLLSSWTTGVVEKSSVLIPFPTSRTRSNVPTGGVEESIQRWGLRRTKGKRK